MAFVLQILIAESSNHAMESRSEVVSVPCLGLVGDRYFWGEGNLLTAASEA
jgi:hypothetical protein